MKSPLDINPKVLLTLLLFLISFALILVPYQSIFLAEISFPTPVACDLDVTGFEIYNSSKTEVIANAFDFLETTTNVTAFGLGVNSVSLLENSFSDNAKQSEIFLNSTGGLVIAGVNIKYFSYILEGNNSATLRFDGSSNSYLPDPLEDIFDPEPVQEDDVKFSLYDSCEKCSIFSYNDQCRLMITFGAHDGEITIIGNQTHVLSLKNEYLTMILDLSTPTYAPFQTNIFGDLNGIYIRGWTRLDYLFQVPEGSSVFAKNAKGTIFYSEQKTEASGTHSFSFTNFYDRVHITKLDSPNSYHISLNGHTSEIVSSFAEKSNIINQKHYFPDYLWSPYPIFVSGLTVLGATTSIIVSQVFWRKLSWALLLIVSVTIFSICSLIWAIKTQQPVWVQNVFSFVPLYVNIMTFLVDRKKQEK